MWGNGWSSRWALKDETWQSDPSRAAPTGAAGRGSLTYQARRRRRRRTGIHSERVLGFEFVTGEKHSTFFLRARGGEVFIFYFHRGPVALHPAEKRPSGSRAEPGGTGGDVRLHREAGCKQTEMSQRLTQRRLSKPAHFTCLFSFRQKAVKTSFPLPMFLF